MMDLNREISMLQAKTAAPSINQLRDVIGRLAATIEEENHVLAERRELSLDPLIYKKSQLLLELMRAQKSCQPGFHQAQSCRGNPPAQVPHGRQPAVAFGPPRGGTGCVKHHT